MRVLAAWLLGLLLATMLAGCSSSEAPASAPKIIRGCIGLDVPGLTCTETNGTVQLSGRVERGAWSDADWPVGLPISTGSVRSWLLKDLVVDGFGVGVRVNAMASCDCTVTLDNVTLRGPAGGVGEQGYAQALSPNTMQTGNEGKPDLQVTARHVDVSGMRVGLDFNLSLSRVTLEDVRIACEESGILQQFGYAGLDATGLDITGCSRYGLLLQGAGAAVVRDSHFTNNTFALSESYSDAEGLTLSDSTFEGNGVAVMAALSANSGSLLPCTNQAASIAGSRFIDNGHADPWLTGLGVPAAAVLPGPFGMRIQDSFFEGNTPALAFVDSDGQPSAGSTCATDAAQNWWGSSNGPWRFGGDAAPVGSFGDAVPVGTPVDPFLTTPP